MTAPTVSLVLLTWNRLNVALATLRYNMERAGYPIHELIHVDNGSDRKPLASFTSIMSPDVSVHHMKNMGVAKGYNRGMVLATGSHVVITGMDRYMPDNWLLDWVNAFTAIPRTGVISLYSTREFDATRYTGEATTYRGVNIRCAIPFEARMHSREFLARAGFFHEGFGLYGFEDWEWKDRAERVAREDDLINYVLADQPLARHVETSDMPDYQRFKDSQSKHDQAKRELALKLREEGAPYFNPFPHRLV